MSEINPISNGGPNLNLLQQAQYFRQQVKQGDQLEEDIEESQELEKTQVTPPPSQGGGETPLSPLAADASNQDDQSEGVTLSNKLTQHLSQTAEAARAAQSARQQAQSAKTSQGDDFAASQTAQANLVGQSAAGFGALPTTPKSMGVNNDAMEHLDRIDKIKPVFTLNENDFTDVQYLQDGILG